MTVGLEVVERRLTEDLRKLDQEVAVTELVRVELVFHVHPSELGEANAAIEELLEFSGAEIERWTGDKTRKS